LNELTRALLISLQVATVAVLLITLFAVPLAFLTARSRSTLRNLIDILVTLPLVLPPTVVGYAIILLLGRRGTLGQYLDSWFGYSIMFHWHGAVLAAAVVAFPLAYLPARAAFAAVDRELEDTARLHGAGLLGLFWNVSLPLAIRSILTGTVLAFARALGEFGATIMVLGDTTRYRTLPIVLYNDCLTGSSSVAASAAALLGLVSLVVVCIHNRLVK
jgi:molybdate transport system permease protein